MAFVSKHPNLSSLLVALVIDAVAVAILVAAFPPRF
jgi:hypothetical protein